MRFSDEFHESIALPTPVEELLLQAAIGRDADAADMLLAWKLASRAQNYDQVSFADTRLLPLVYRRLLAASSADSATIDGDGGPPVRDLPVGNEPWLPQLAALSKYHWLRNTGSQRDMLQISSALTDAGIEHVILGGLSLIAAGCFDDLGERPLIDREILISPRQTSLVGEVLTALGWNSPRGLPPVAGWRRRETWSRGAGELFHIYYQWLPKGFPTAPAERILERSQQCTLGGTRVRILDTTDLLHLTCVANRRNTEDGAFRFVWAADAARILERTTTHFDWDRLLTEAHELKTLYPLRESLAYLYREFAAKVPEPLIEAAYAVSLADSDCEPFRAFVKGTSRPLWRRSARTLAKPYRDYLAAERIANRQPSLRGLLHYWGWRLHTEVSRSRKAA